MSKEAMRRATHRPWTSPHCPRIHGKAAVGAERYTRTGAKDNHTGITDKQRKGGQSRHGPKTGQRPRKRASRESWTELVSDRDEKARERREQTSDTKREKTTSGH